MVFAKACESFVYVVGVCLFANALAKAFAKVVAEAFVKYFANAFANAFANVAAEGFEFFVQMSLRKLWQMLLKTLLREHLR